MKIHGPIVHPTNLEHPFKISLFGVKGSLLEPLQFECEARPNLLEVDPFPVRVEHVS